MENLIEKSINQRFSPMIFDEKFITKEQLDVLIYSASLSASSFNAQPWRFIYGHKGSKDYELLTELLVDYNKKWTNTAPLLMLGVANTKTDKGQENYYALHDIGQAVSAMAIQASSMGLQVHQMGGYDMQKARELLNIPNDYLPASIFAIGYPGDNDKLEGHFKERAYEKRIRKPVFEISGGVDFFKK